MCISLIVYYKFTCSTLSVHVHIAYPVSSSAVVSSTVTVQKGHDAVLHPLIPPGMLLAQYFIDWINSSSADIIATIQGPRAISTVFNPDSRYFVDPNTFALTIRGVSFSDRGLYSGVLGVADPAGRELTYMQTQSLKVDLDVYGKKNEAFIVFTINRCC